MNATDLPGSDLEAIPAGRYKLGVKDMELKVSETSKNPYLNIEFVVTTPGDYHKRRVFEIIVLTSKSLWRLKAFLVAIGAGKTELSINKDVTGDYDINYKAVLEEVREAGVGPEIDADVELV